jgi:hypothetical protein
MKFIHFLIRLLQKIPTDENNFIQQTKNDKITVNYLGGAYTKYLKYLNKIKNLN